MPPKSTEHSSYLPGFDQDAHTGSHEDHPTCVFVVVDEIQQDNNLHKDVCNNLKKSIQ
jgi:hypothetical protein